MAELLQPIRVAIRISIISLIFAALIPGPFSEAADNPARFWFSLSDQDPFRRTLQDVPASEPQKPELRLAPGDPLNTAKLYLWGQPQTDQSEAHAFRRLQNLSLNISLPDPRDVSIQSVQLENPGSPSNRRYKTLVDSFTQDVPGTNLPIHSPNGISGIVGFTVSSPTSATGFGQDCSGQGPCTTIGVGPPWLVGRVDIRGLNVSPIPTQSTPLTEGWLQVGKLSITHTDEGDPYTQVLFGDAVNSVPFDANVFREVTVGGDGADVSFVVQQFWPGDYNRDHVVDAADYTVWRDTLSATPLPFEDADGDGDGIITPNDYEVWRSHYGLQSLPFGSGSGGVLNARVPTPSALLLAFMTMLAVAVARRRKLARPVVIVACCTIFWHIDSSKTLAQPVSWTNAANGLWSNSANWTPAVVPDNGGANSYDVTIDALGGIYTVELFAPITVSNLDMASADATLFVSGTSLTIENVLALNDGTVTLDSSTFLDGIIDLMGGTVAYSSATLSGAMINGQLDLSPAFSSVTLTNGTSFTGGALIGANSQMTVADSLTFDDQTVDLSGVSSQIQVSGNNTLMLGSNALTLLGGSGANITALGSDTLINQGTIRTTGASTKTIDVPTIDNSGTIEVTAGTLEIDASSSITNSGTLQVDSGATLNLLGSATYTHSGVAQLIGSGTVQVDSSSGTFINAAIVSPGSSPGTLTIDNDYTQTSDGVLELEVPGDELVVNGTADLAGRLDIIAGDQLANFGMTLPVVSATSRVGTFENYHITGLGALPIGIRLDYSASGLSAVYATTSSASLSTAAQSDPTLDWHVASTWSGSVPTSLSAVTLENTGVSGLQTVSVTTSGSPINAAHRLSVGGGSDDLKLEVDGRSLSVSTTTTISPMGTIELTGDGALLTSEFVNIEGGGTLTGVGDLIANVEVGSSGSGAATFDPVGSLRLKGSYTQNAIGEFASAIFGMNTGGGNDLLSVTDTVTLAGDLNIDVAGLSNAEFSNGDTYELILAEGSITGTFDNVSVSGRDDVYFRIEYDSAGSVQLGETSGGGSSSSQNRVTATVFDKGNGNGDDVIDELDAELFAAVLLNNNLLIWEYTCHNNTACTAIGPFFDAYNFTESRNDIQEVDFHDIPRFAAALAGSSSISLGAAYAMIESAIANSQAPKDVPEPASLVLLASVAAVLAPRRRRSR